SERCILQSFDPAILEAGACKRDDLLVALPVRMTGDEGNLARCFKPNIYSPHYSMANEAMLKNLRERDIELVVGR
ncbi:MAG: hypothetical protein IPO87_14560, partial [Flavobacteriales bacterium]|nr:hypothetical protein [Flavobacteriales bacterium]